MVYGQVYGGDEHAQPRGVPCSAVLPSGDVFWQLLEGNFMPCLSAVFRRTALSRVGLLDDSNPGIDDYDFFIRLAELYPVIAWPHPVGVWRVPQRGSQQLSTQTMHMLAITDRLFCASWLRLPRAQEAPA